MSDRQRLSVEQIQQAITSGTITESVVLDLWAAYEAMQQERDTACEAAAEWREKLASVMVDRDTYRTLSGIGVWHADCRPNREMAARELQKSQAVIDKLADTIAGLKQELLLQAQDSLEMVTRLTIAKEAAEAKIR